MTTRSARPIVLRDGGRIEDPIKVALGILEGRSQLVISDPVQPNSFGESDLRLANRHGARISATEIAMILGRRRRIERDLTSIGQSASLAAPAKEVPWSKLGRLFDAFADIKGVGFSKMTKALHPKRPALVPMLDSVVQKYLVDDDPGTAAPFGARALDLARGYKRELDRNRAAVRAIRHELWRRGYGLSEVRILDLLIWYVESTQ